MQEIRFDDITGLEAAVSEEFGAFGPEKTVTQEMIDRFAELTGDHQWIHVDVERAKKESPFGGPIAHGFFTLALVPALRPGRTFAVTGYASAVNYGSDGFRFLAPVPSGSAVQARSRLAAVSAKPKGTLVTTETAVHVVGNETPSLLYKGLTLYRPPKG
ncbi:MAG: MaoC family dehydratase [Deltaproteobacteria bacterium]|nr:MaoC family dehydratase [Deltaproteobacteria bacterium]MBW2447495.1 MaoC family dehydratase [Deltaproteobacteria bacterium]